MRTLFLSLTVLLAGCAEGMQNSYNPSVMDNYYLQSLPSHQEVTINSTEELNKSFANPEPGTSYRVAPGVLDDFNKPAPFNLR